MNANDTTTTTWTRVINPRGQTTLLQTKLLPLSWQDRFGFLDRVRTHEVRLTLNPDGSGAIKYRVHLGDTLGHPIGHPGPAGVAYSSYGTFAADKRDEVLGQLRMALDEDGYQAAEAVGAPLDSQFGVEVPR